MNVCVLYRIQILKIWRNMRSNILIIPISHWKRQKTNHGLNRVQITFLLLILIWIWFHRPFKLKHSRKNIAPEFQILCSRKVTNTFCFSQPFFIFKNQSHEQFSDIIIIILYSNWWRIDFHNYWKWKKNKSRRETFDF